MFYFPSRLMTNIYLVMVKTNFACMTIKNKMLLEKSPAVLLHRIKKSTFIFISIYILSKDCE